MADYPRSAKYKRARQKANSVTNTITSFIRTRMGINGDRNGTVTIANGHDMIFDHLSVS
jgi:hypothetical protein